MSKVIEYLGLPAVGKSWQLVNQGYCLKVNASPRTVPLGGGGEKLRNTWNGIVHRPKLFAYLLWVTITNPSTFNTKTSIRPIFVVPERIGRRKRILSTHTDECIHTDEGAIQFIWRVFYEKKITDRNIKMLELCLKALKVEPDSVVYFHCNKKKHIERIHLRSKNQPFDQNAIAGNLDDYVRGRTWMSYILRFLRKNGLRPSVVAL